ncbi:MAG: hypothetical protein ABIJ45_03110 [Candidatus Zixiibacteriota bacterium]
MKKCSHHRGDSCVFCTVTGGENYKCAIFRRTAEGKLDLNRPSPESI